MPEYEEHGMARTELADARERVKEENYSAAATFVKNSKLDVADSAAVDYGEWRERYEELIEMFVEGIAWESGGRANSYRTDQEGLLAILDELEDTLDEMDRLKKEFREFRERHARTEAPTWTASGWSRELTGDEVPEDLEFTCVGCRRGLARIGSMYFELENHPDNRVLCGECLFEIDVIDREEADPIEVDTPETSMSGGEERIAEMRDALDGDQ